MSFARRAVEKAIISISGPRRHPAVGKKRSEHARRDRRLWPAMQESLDDEKDIHVQWIANTI